MGNTDLKTEVILDYGKVEQNTYTDNAGTVSIINKAASELGLTIRRNPKWKTTYINYKGKKIGHLKGLKVGTTSSEAFNICRDKYRLENFLREMGVSTLLSKLFSVTEKDKAYEFIQQNTDYKYVLKPLSLAGGNGIELNVSEENFSESWDRSIKAQKFRKVQTPSCIVQPYIEGFDIRVSIIEGQFSSAILRLPAHVIGDGKGTINELIKYKNEKRFEIAYFKNKMIPINSKLESRLSSKNLNLDSVLEKNQVVILSDISNLTVGGESIDITEEISDEIRDLAIHSVASIPGLYTAGVDIMTDNFKGSNGYIIEVNTNANHTLNHLPLKGNVTKPFNDLLENLLIKYKVKNTLNMSQVEKEKFSELYKFDTIKHKYNNKLYKLSGF